MRTSVIVSANLELQFAKALDDAAQQVGISRSAAIKEAITLFIERSKESNQRDPETS